MTIAPTRGAKGLFASVLAAALVCTATGAGAAAPPATPTVATNTNRIYFGVDGTVSKAAQGVGVARHIYGELGTSVPNAGMVTMGIDGYVYTDISSAAPGSAIYNDVVRWADTIKARATQTFFGFSHEPEASASTKFGNAQQFIAAYRHVVDIIRSRNVPNVRFVWQMTAYSFAAKANQHQYADSYYPGDSYVDDVAEDAYNWDGCAKTDSWRDLSTIADPALDFAAAHNKLVIIAEFASQAGPQRAAWLSSAAQWLIANHSRVQAAFYFDRPPTGGSCNWSLTSPTDVAAFRAIVADTTYFTASAAAAPRRSVPGDLTGSGRTSIAVFRPATGTWYTRGAASVGYGQAGDIPVPGDYAGDGRASIAVFRPATGTWYIRGAASVRYGQAGDIPVPGDYTGNGTTSIAVYRPSTGTWYIRGVGDHTYGTRGDIPVPGDYSHDGTTSIAVFRPSTGTWYISGAASVRYGRAGDVPAPGDYNGDGRTSIALFRPSTGTWYLRGVGSYIYGQAGDVPAPGDYHGDGTTSIALFRPSTGTWFIRGIGDYAYGQAADIPV